MKIGELLNQGVEFFAARENALLDAEILLAHSLGVEKEFLIKNRDQEVDEEFVSLYHQYIRRVDQGEPVAYVTLEKEFFGLNFYVDSRVLIPRPETELLVEEALNFMKANEGMKFKVLDVGTGSGNIAVSLAKTFEDGIDFVNAVDLEEGAVEVAGLNAQQHGVDDRVFVIQSDLLDFADGDEEYDIIVANLPYIGEVKNRFVSAEAEKYEPGVALFGGETGLELYKKMFQQIVDKNIGFKLLLGEFGFAQTEDMELILNNYFEQNWLIKKDYAGIDRMFMVKM